MNTFVYYAYLVMPHTRWFSHSVHVNLFLYTLIAVSVLVALLLPLQFNHVKCNASRIFIAKNLALYSTKHDLDCFAKFNDTNGVETSDYIQCEHAIISGTGETIFRVSSSSDEHRPWLRGRNSRSCHERFESLRQDRSSEVNYGKSLHERSRTW